ncbi:SET domain-containing protein [Mycena sanguinolenta]|uniref:SET domain-containing protein n=1 Tax=Mycena sanguinolenta TaxID=230812 RepID=A0A8H7CS19_9AGAR|nr:SET domain-containing protein [Mycena sanguinolenta]
MTESTTLSNLLAWCSKRDFWIDPRIQIIAGPCGVAVFSRDTPIPPDSILVRIPRESVLSVKSSSISDLIPPHPYGRGAQFSLALALSVELVNGATSPFLPYLKSLPREIPDIPLFWGAHQPTLAQYGPPMEWLNGTEASKILFDSGDNHNSLFSDIDQYFDQVACSVYGKVFESSPEMTPSLQDFYHAYALVASRSFLVDSYHGLAMVPIADAFNHAQENHVHLESDFDVCPECGSLQRCVHDATLEHIPRSTNSDGADDFYEMVSNLAIPPNSEVFNTYGEALNNAELLVQYGFILDGNDNDHLTWTFNELAQFSENHLSASSWTWDSVGGRAHFQDLLRSISSLLWDRVSESELVTLDRTRTFSLNGDAIISHSLWLYFALLACLRNAASGPPNKSALVVLLEEILECQIALEQRIASEEDKSELMLVPPQLPDDEQRRASPYGIILELAQLLASLCRARSARTGRAGVEMTELGEILDVRRTACGVLAIIYFLYVLRRAFLLQRLPNDMTPTRMAISLALTERSLLDSCISSWEVIADFLEA